MTDKKKKILVVEDEKSLNEAYELILSKAGYGVMVAFDGQDALDKLEKFKPHIILLDLKMPHMDGIAFLRSYSALADKGNAPKIIVFSNYDLQDEIDQAFDLGAHKYVLKSWASPQDLLKIVSEIEKS